MVERRIYVLGEEALGSMVRHMTDRPTKYGSGGDGGDGGDGSNLAARIAKLESSVEHIEADIKEMRDDVRTIKSSAERDFRILFGAIIFVALGLAGLMAKGFKWL